MKILVINGDCIQTNTSANLCHLAYLRGLVDAGHEVTLLSADGEGYRLDPAMVIPEQIKCYTYRGMSIYERLSLKKKKKSAALPAESPQVAASTDRCVSLITKVKRAVLSLYGIHGIYATFVRKAQKFTSNEDFDCILSLSTPVTSHLLTHNLLRAGHIHGKHWVQIWEDPWYSDAYGFNRKEKIRREEERLLSFAEKVCYVSPLTLQNQQRLYPESAHKMFWQPLPYYYKEDEETVCASEKRVYGYFGDYVPESRDLEPFYEAAKEAGVEVNICGNPQHLFVATDHIRIYPRLPLDELKPIENHTAVLVFLCNRKGGQIPGKLYQYSATAKTILFILDGTAEEQATLRDYFEPYARYVFCQNTKRDIARAIRQIESGDLGNIQNYPLACFEPATIVQKILMEANDGGSNSDFVYV